MNSKVKHRAIYKIQGPGSMMPSPYVLFEFCSSHQLLMRTNVVKLGKTSFWLPLSEGSSQCQSSAEALAVMTLCSNFSLCPVLVPSLSPQGCILKTLAGKCPSGMSPSQSLLPGKTNLYIFAASPHFLSFQFEIPALFPKHLSMISLPMF